jgi:catechol 2,3-dioxygenase-like lactoylglutathione lyase family enzyme
MAPETDPQLRKISAMSLFVEDLTAAKAFYQEVFGVPVVFEDEAAVVVQFENLLINILRVESAGEIVAPGPVGRRNAGSRFQLSVWVKDVNAVCARLEARGVRLLTGPIDRAWGKRTANFIDPAGHSWEVAQDI